MNLSKLKKIIYIFLLFVILFNFIYVSSLDNYKTIDDFNAKLYSNKGTYNLADKFKDSDNGKILVDKSVSVGEFKINDEVIVPSPEEQGGEFNVMLSALSQEYNTIQYPLLPPDVVFLLDVSISMKYSYPDAEGNFDKNPELKDTRIKSAVDVLNTTIDSLMKKNFNTRIGIVAYNGSSPGGSYDEENNTWKEGIKDNYPVSLATKILLELDSYTPNDLGEYLELIEADSSIKIQTCCANKYKKIDENIEVKGGTYTQGGIVSASSLLESAEFNINEEGKADRVPVMILMTDGGPSRHALTNDFSSIRNGTQVYGAVEIEKFSGNSIDDLPGNYAVPTISAAVTAKEKWKNHYNRDPLFCTIGLGINENTWESTSLNPIYKDGVFSNLKYPLQLSKSIPSWNYHNIFNSNWLGDKNKEKVNYSDASFFNINNGEALGKALSSIVGSINIFTERPVEGRGEAATITFEDKIGEGMSAIDIPILRYSGCNYGGKDKENIIGYIDSSDSKIRTYYYKKPVKDPNNTFSGNNLGKVEVPYKKIDGSESFDSVDYYYTISKIYDDNSNYMWDFNVPVRDLFTNNINNLNKITLKISNDNSQILTWIIPEDLVPIYSSLVEYTELQPIRLIFTESLKEKPISKIYYSNDFKNTNGECIVDFRPDKENPYYYKLLLNENRYIAKYTDWSDLEAVLTIEEREDFYNKYPDPDESPEESLNFIIQKLIYNHEWSYSEKYQTLKLFKNDKFTINGIEVDDVTNTSNTYYYSDFYNNIVNVYLGNNGKMELKEKEKIENKRLGDSNNIIILIGVFILSFTNIIFVIYKNIKKDKYNY